MKFKITYLDPKDETSESWITEYVDFEASENPKISAMEWAEDYAYAVADKGAYHIEEV